MCDHRIAEDGPLTCTRLDHHAPGHGCIYESTSAGDDRHIEGGHG